MEDLFGNTISKVNRSINGKGKDNRPMPKDDNSTDTCRNCQHLIRHTYSDKMKYCSKYKQKNTANGLLKIKSGLKACVLFIKNAKPI